MWAVETCRRAHLRIKAVYPHLTEEQIGAALEYADSHTAEIQADIDYQSWD